MTDRGVVSAFIPSEEREASLVSMVLPISEVEIKFFPVQLHSRNL